MAVGALAAAVAAGAAMKSKGQRKAAKTKAQGFQAGLETAEEAINTGYDDAMKYLSPYAQFGESTLPYLQQYLQQPQNFSYGDFYNSQQYKDLSAQQEEQVARNALATGPGLRSGNAQVGLAAIAPQLAMQERQYQDQNAQNRFNNVFNLAQFGGGLGQNAANMAVNRGSQLADYRYNAATGGAGARAQGQLGHYNTWGQAFEDFGTLAAGGMGGIGGKGGAMGGFGGFGGGQQGGFNMQGYQAPNYFTQNYGWMNRGG